MVISVDSVLLQKRARANALDEAAWGAPGGEISVTRQDASGGAPSGVFDDDFGPGDTVQVGQNISDDVINLRYTGGDGRVVVAELVTDDDIGTNDCVVSGFAIGG